MKRHTPWAVYDNHIGTGFFASPSVVAGPFDFDQEAYDVARSHFSDENRYFVDKYQKQLDLRSTEL